MTSTYFVLNLSGSRQAHQNSTLHYDVGMMAQPLLFLIVFRVITQLQQQRQQEQEQQQPNKQTKNLTNEVI